MPLPQSRIGRVVLLGIVLGILLVFVVAVSASVAFAQEAPLPESPDSGAVGPPVGESADKASVGPVIDSPGQRNAEDVACRTAEALLNLYPFHFERDWKNSWLKSLNSTVRELGTYCGTKDELHSDDARTRMSWILGVRSYDFHLMRRLVEATGKPQSVVSRKKLAKFEDVIAELHFDSDALLRWEMFRLTKPRIAEVPKEVVRTVEVPVQIPCPAPEPRVSPCARVLSQSMPAWSEMLYDYTRRHEAGCSICSGYEQWKFTQQSATQMNGLIGDPTAYCIGWLVQYRQVVRDATSSLVVPEPLRLVAADMRAKLRYCGVAAEEDR